jgi:hypothetical protein
LFVGDVVACCPPLLGFKSFVVVCVRFIGYIWIKLLEEDVGGGDLYCMSCSFFHYFGLGGRWVVLMWVLYAIPHCNG